MKTIITTIMFMIPAISYAYQYETEMPHNRNIIDVVTIKIISAEEARKKLEN